MLCPHWAVTTLRPPPVEAPAQAALGRSLQNRQTRQPGNHMQWGSRILLFPGGFNHAEISREAE